MYGRFCIKFPQSRMKGERHRLSGLSLQFLVFSDYGEKENADLADKYGITKEQYPVYRLFLNGDLEGIPYKGDTKRANEIKKFLMTEAGNILQLNK